jgi:hypothetical protein
VPAGKMNEQGSHPARDLVEDLAMSTPKFGVPFQHYPIPGKGLRSVCVARCSQEYFRVCLAWCEYAATMTA